MNLLLRILHLSAKQKRPNLLFLYIYIYISAWFVVSGVQLQFLSSSRLEGGNGKGRDHGNLLAHDGLKERLLVFLLLFLLMKHLHQGGKRQLWVCVLCFFFFFFTFCDFSPPPPFLSHGHSIRYSRLDGGCRRKRQITSRPQYKVPSVRWQVGTIIQYFALLSTKIYRLRQVLACVSPYFILIES